MTVAEFVARDDGTGTRYELAYGAPMAMAPPSGWHVVITRNIARAIERQVHARCGVVMSGGVARAEGADELRLPDVFVSCEPTPPVYFREPRLVVEVLSPPTEKIERTAKLDFYRSLPSMEAILFVWEDQRRVQLIEWDGARWMMRDVSSRFDIAGLGVGLRLDDIYAGVDLPAEAG